MNIVRPLVVAFVLVTLIIGCKGSGGETPEPTQASQTELLVANNWQTKQVTTPDGQEINEGRLNLVTQYLFGLNMQFRQDGSVRALDFKQSNKVVNGGSWALAADNKSIDVDVTGFKGNFPIVRLDRSNLILRQTAPVDGKNAEINLVFVPAL
ncbi:hypothetical protein ACFSUS_16420 [Spirosoma soli]|uniref:Lipocalin-like domain-containing protein n=1 Tax=Spirosoma soli TaxID=1770529 RepID=A0ABW5M6D0_9BACT